MSLFCLIILQAVHNRFMSSVLCILPLASDVHISFTITCISFKFSTCSTVPLVCVEYLLTAVCVIPRSLAMSVCFSPYDCLSSFATYALNAGITDFTATSQGIGIGVFLSVL